MSSPLQVNQTPKPQEITLEKSQNESETTKNYGLNHSQEQIHPDNLPTLNSYLASSPHSQLSATKTLSNDISSFPADSRNQQGLSNKLVIKNPVLVSPSKRK